VLTLVRRKATVERAVRERTAALEREAQDRALVAEALRRKEEQQKSGAEALRESEERYRMLAEQSSDFIARYRLDGTLVYASAACRTLLGFEPTELVGTSYYRLFYPADVDPVRQRIRAAAETTAPETVSYRVQRKDGMYVWLESTLRVLHDASTHGASEVVAVSRDISERKRVDRMRQDLVAMLSHDLKNPLTAVLGFAEILREAPPDDPQRDDFLARIEANAHSALSLAINFVDASQIESGTLEPRLEPVFVNDIVEHVLRHQESRARVKQIRLETRLDRSRPMAMLDRRLIDRIVANLVNNAIKFSPAKSDVLVETAVRDGMVLVRVEDQGPGIAADQRPKLFQRFSEIGGRRVDSTGLGLFIVKTLVDAQGGTVAAQFPPDGGTVFEVTFPAG
jgi:PAS domain S-box-containing protein